jgi:hypothetical protein
MRRIRYKRIPPGMADCPLHPTPVPATWFVYIKDDGNALPLCTGHALSQVGTAWALGNTVIVDGVQYDPPPPFVEHEEAA